MVGVSTVPVTGTSQALELLSTANKNRYEPHARDKGAVEHARGSHLAKAMRNFKAMNKLLYQGLPVLAFQVLPWDGHEREQLAQPLRAEAVPARPPLKRHKADRLTKHGRPSGQVRGLETCCPGLAVDSPVP